MHRFLKHIFIALFILVPTVTFALPTNRLSVIIIDSNDKSPLSLATVRLKSNTGEFFGSITDMDGRVEFPAVKEGTYEVIVTYIGYEDYKKQIQIKKSSRITIYMNPSSTLLTEVIVTASESKGITSASKIDKTAMEHLQPSSFTDLLALIPGGSTKTPDMSGPNAIKLREVAVSSSDYNTSSLGTQFVIDGTPINTDANMQRVRTEITSGFEGKTSVNTGVDMRTISTDNIESVEIIRGIPSVEYGDLTSGLVVIKRKLKGSPIEARFKADQYSSLFSVGKGVEFAEKNLTLAADAGFLDSHNDPRDKMSNYKRINFSLRMQKVWNRLNGDNLRLNSAVDYSGNIDASKNDPEILTQPEDKFKSSFHSVKWQNMFRWNAASEGVFRNLTANFTASTSVDKISRTRFVQLDRDRVAPTNMVPGVHDGAILPYQYTAHHEVDGKPLNLYANVKAEFQVNRGEWKNKILTGATWTYAKNLGDGEVYDLARPLNPMASSARPRKYSDIPASEQLSFFIEEKMHYPIGQHSLDIQAGIRANMLLNLNNGYAMNGKIYLDPRANLQWKFPGIRMGKKELVFNIAGGVGGLTKMPTLIHLYPNDIYMDFVQLNYWNQNPDLKRINMLTYIVDPTNFNLKPARNFKWEVRLGAEFDKNEFSVTYFRERMSSGFRSLSTYAPYEYREYDASGINGNALTAPPALESLPFKEQKILNGYGYYGNGSRTLKEGVEFQLSTKRFDVINTRLTINGAWFKSTYQNSQPVYKSVTKVIGNTSVSNLYMGLYENDDNYVNERFNTNFIIDTWLSKIGVKLSETIECSWFQTRQSGYVSGMPIAYMDLTGQLTPYTEADKTDLYKQHLIINYNEGAFNKTKNPFYMYVNFKATKDFGKHISVSLFADRILDYVPDYESNGLNVRRTALSPYFGMELNLKL